MWIKGRDSMVLILVQCFGQCGRTYLLQSDQLNQRSTVQNQMDDYVTHGLLPFMNLLNSSEVLSTGGWPEVMGGKRVRRKTLVGVMD